MTLLAVKILTAWIQQNSCSPNLSAWPAPYPSDCPQTQVKGHVATCTYGRVKAESRDGGEKQPLHDTKVPVPHPPIKKTIKERCQGSSGTLFQTTIWRQMASSAKGSYGRKVTEWFCKLHYKYINNIFKKKSIFPKNKNYVLRNISIITNKAKIHNVNMKLFPPKDSRSDLSLLIEVSYPPVSGLTMPGLNSEQERLAPHPDSLGPASESFVRHTQCVPARSRDNTRAHPLSRQ